MLATQRKGVDLARKVNWEEELDQEHDHQQRQQRKSERTAPIQGSVVYTRGGSFFLINLIFLNA